MTIQEKVDKIIKVMKSEAGLHWEELDVSTRIYVKTSLEAILVDDEIE